MRGLLRAFVLVLGVGLGAMSADCARADDDVPSNGEPPEAREVARERVRQAMRRQLQTMQERQKRLARAMQLLEEGRPIVELRREFQDLGPVWNTPGGPEPMRPREGPDAPSGDGMNPMDQLDRPLPGGGPGMGGPDRGPGMNDGPAGGGIRPRGPRPNGREPEGPVEIGEKELTFVEEFLSSSAPMVLERFRELRHRDPGEARRRFTQMFPRVRFLYELRERDPAMYKLRMEDIRFARQSLEAAREIAQIDARGEAQATDAHSKAATRLRESLRRQYQARTELLKLESAKARQHAERMLIEIDKRPAQEDGVVEKFFDAMIKHERLRGQRRGDGARGDGPDDPVEPAPEPDRP